MPLTLHQDEDFALRLPELRHARQVFDVVDANRDHLRKWLPWVDSTQSPVDSESFIRAVLDDLATGRSLQCAIWVGDAIAGLVGYHRINWMARKTEIGYWLAESYQGQGLMTRATTIMINHAFGELDLNRLEIHAATENTRSRAIPERLGFTLEGVTRQTEWNGERYLDHAIYGLLAREWNERR